MFSMNNSELTLAHFRMQDWQHQAQRDQQAQEARTQQGDWSNRRGLLTIRKNASKNTDKHSSLN